MITVLARNWKLIFGITLAGAIVSIVVSLLMPKVFTGVAVIMPPQQDQSSATAILGQLVGAGGGVASALGLKNANDLYVGVLKSRTIADRLIERFKLQDLYEADTLVDTRKALGENASIAASRDGLITIAFEDEDPKRAADIANAYVEELEVLTAQLAFSDASRRRLYFERQLEQTKAALVKADFAFKDVQEKTGLIKPDFQAGAIFQSMAALSARIAAKEIEQASVRTYATERSPDYIRIEQELSAMRQQLANFERSNKQGSGEIFVPTSKVPGAALQYLEKFRDVKYHETLYELLARQFELAKIDEGKNATIIQVMDRAVVPDKKSKPKRALIVIASTMLAALFAIAFCFFREAWLRASLSPEHAARISELRRNLRLS